MLPKNTSHNEICQGYTHNFHPPSTKPGNVAAGVGVAGPIFAHGQPGPGANRGLTAGNAM